jgi:hypothetical protein
MEIGSCGGKRFAFQGLGGDPKSEKAKEEFLVFGIQVVCKNRSFLE